MNHLRWEIDEWVATDGRVVQTALSNRTHFATLRSRVCSLFAFQ